MRLATICALMSALSMLSLACQPQKPKEQLPPPTVQTVDTASGIETPPPVVPVAPPIAPTGSGTYTVKAGDTLYGIAKRELGDGKRWKEIAELNGGLEPSKLKIGQTIKLPGK